MTTTICGKREYEWPTDSGRQTCARYGNDGTIEGHVVRVDGPYVPARLTGRCADGAERDGGRKIHAVALTEMSWGHALCGARPGRLSNGWVEVNGPEVPTCPRCRRRGEKSEAQS